MLDEVEKLYCITFFNLLSKYDDDTIITFKNPFDKYNHVFKMFHKSCNNTSVQYIKDTLDSMLIYEYIK